MEYFSDDRADNVLQELNAQRMARQFCDVKLVTGNETIYAHRCILSASSDYFRALFLGDFSDCQAGEWRISACEPKALQTIVAYMYTGRIKITLQNVDDVLQSADYLCLKEVTSFCSDLLRRNMNETNCVQIKALTDRFSLVDIRSDVVDFLAPRMSAILAMPGLIDMPFDYIYPLVSDMQLNYIREADLLGFILRWIEHSPEDRRSYAQQLAACVDFSYLGSEYIERNVMSSKYITDVLLPPQTKALHIKLSEQTYPTRMEDMIACRSRVVGSGDEARLLFYAIRDDRWYTLADYPECELLAGLESMASDHGSLYVLSSRREDICGYAHGSKVSKQLWKLSLDRAQWSQMPAPVNLAGQSRLVPHVRGLYVIDRTGVVQKLDNTTNAWVTYSGQGFDESPNATMYLLPMSMDRYIFVLRGYSEGYSFDYSQMSFSLHRYDTDRYTWATLAHIEASELNIDDRDRFHGYEATTTSLFFKDALGLNRVRYDIVSGECTPLDPDVTAPKFIAEIWGSAEYAGYVFFSGRMNYEQPVFMMFDRDKTRFKMVNRPPLHISGLMCHIVVPRSFKESLSGSSNKW
ncbi:hypothetical protein LSH36_563g01077 [Paralvinella palmiformis]|uniref:BTB domain-containing protein n=1 Tax=Paralvinella palmiformis TaxID=53620 RepID=A0AAD9MY30_9ANNE|nr:hypothetical protein LSH36_563g01077 [Paralvinella palmiformis]